MSFLSDLRRELAAHGIRGRLARRIEAELADHLACDPGAELGEPTVIAERFAAELRVVRTRRASVGTFCALAVCVVVLLAESWAHPGAGSPFAALAALGFGQIAFVAGLLALVRGLRGRTPGDLRLAQRRGAVALAAGAGVSLAVATTPAWWLAFLALPALAIAARATAQAASVTPSGAAAGLEGDLGRHAGWVLAALGFAAVALIVFQGVAFEGSGWEGVTRGAIEASGLVAGVVVLGRLLGLRR